MCPVETEVFQADRKTRSASNSRFSQFCQRA